MERDYPLWKWVTGDELLSHGPCELLMASMVASGATTDSVLYDGENTRGEHIVTLESNAKRNLEFKPPEPVFCRRGLYVDVGSNVTGIFVMWRELGYKEGS